MSFLYNNVAVIVVAAVASLMGWLFGGARGELLLPVVPWLCVLMIEVLLCYPQRHHGETTYEARSRVWRQVRRSPIVWTAIGFMVLLAIPFVNNGLCSVCDAALLAEGVDSAPSVPFLPFCVNRLDHLDVFLWFLIALPSVVAVHYSLTRRGKRLVIEMIVWNGAALAMLGFFQGATGAQGPFWTAPGEGRQAVDFFSSFGYPNMGGDYFTVLFGLAVALWRDKFEFLRKEEQEKDKADEAGSARRPYGAFWKRHYFLIPAILFFFAALNTLSRAAIILVSVTAVIYFVHTLVVFLSRMRKSRRVFVGVWSMVVFALILFFATVFMPDKIKKEVDTLGTTVVLDRVTGRGQYHAQVATAIWKDHPLFGCGGWGYLHFCVPKMEELNIDLDKLQVIGGINVHNDYLQLLAEHGIVGFGALVAIVLMLIWPVARQWRDIVHDLRFVKGKNLPPKPIQIFAIPASAFFVMVAVTTTLIHAFGDCPLRSCAVLDLFFISIAALPGFMPKHEHRHHSTTTTR